MKPINPMRYCPMCGARTTPPEHEGDECYNCCEPLGAWRRFGVETATPWLEYLFFLALLIVIALWAG